MVSKLPEKNILITGAAGFIGANLTHRLVALGYSPHIIIRKTSNLWRIKKILNKVKPQLADLEDKAGVEKIITKIKPKIIFHCVTHGGYYFQNDLNRIISANITATVNLVLACLKHKFSCFVNTGSSSEYGIKDKPMRETDLLDPFNGYGISKASATLFCQGLARKENLPLVTLRLFSAYGYYEDSTRLVPSVILSCLDKQPPKVSSPKPVRDFIFIEDVVDAYLRSAQKINQAKGEVINIGSGKQYSVGDVVDKVINLTGSKFSPRWGALTNPRVEPACWVADTRKARRILDWQAKFSLDQGLKKTIDWCSRNEALYEKKD